jgi:anti-sigma factor RsiW
MTMECRDVRPLVEAFVTEQLLVETTQAIEAHLDQCAACHAEVNGLRRLRAATQSAFLNAPALRARPEFLAALGARLQAETAPRPARMYRTWLALAASLLVAVAAGTGWRQWSVSNLTSLLNDAVGDHRFCAVTFRLLEAPIPLEEAAHRFDVVDRALETVEPSTASLSGGPVRIVERHSCVFNGRRFAHLVLRYKGQTVSLLVTEAADRGAGVWGLGPVDEGTTSAFPVTDGFHVTAFRRSRHVVFFVSSLGQDDVQEVARAMVAHITRALAEG